MKKEAKEKLEKIKLKQENQCAKQSKQKDRANHLRNKKQSITKEKK